MKLEIYVNYPGNCAEAMTYYEKHLGAKVLMRRTYEEMTDARFVPEGMEKHHILHARLELAGTQLLMSDGPHVEPMRSSYLTLDVETAEEAERVHETLSKGGEIFMPMGETFFAHRFSMLRDQFGTNWMVISRKPM